MRKFLLSPEGKGRTSTWLDSLCSAKAKKNTWILSISLLLENKYVVCESFWQPSQRFVEFVMLGEKWEREKKIKEEEKLSRAVKTFARLVDSKSTHVT
ncbi:hypothetical protein TNIN_336851 [Trichonephila inaurata madagascariensis]|uniref:Uncharacterized protein n=1 Tax=Trichonephila inaurata madagascariensis TaxID=2747483 RepID=A0A8X7BP63_9ARAC|nr:hypothetical protein TNIN_336851 [Trichonephila inaurata madagascariensis]